MTRYLGVLILMGLLSSGASAVSSGLPPLTVPDCLGVNIHFTGTEAEQVAKIAEEGFRFIRMDFSWVHIEREKGKYDFSKYDELVDSLATRGIRAYFILDYGNPLYDNDMAPHTDEGRAAFVRFASAGVEHFKGKGVVWELWNEPNIFFWRPKPNVEDYVKLAKVVYPALKKADPDALLLAPALAGGDTSYLENAFKLGLLDYTDVVSLHPYGSGKPEDAAVLYGKVRQLIAQYAPKGRQYEIVSGEWGYSTFNKGVSEETQADYIVRQALSNMMNRARITIWYDWRDDGPDPNENEHRFGTVRQNMEGKPSFFAMKTLTTELNGYTYASRIRPGTDEDYLALFRKGDDYRLATWTTGDPHWVSLPFDVAEAEVVSRSGERTKAEIKDGKIRLHLTQSPQYVEPAGKSALWAAEAAWKVDAKAKITDKGLMVTVNASAGEGGAISLSGKGVDKAAAPETSGDGPAVPYQYSGQLKPEVTVTLKLPDLKEPIVRVVEVDVSDCPRLEVLPSAEKEIIIRVRRPESIAKDALTGNVNIGNPQGIRFEKLSAPVALAKGQTEALVRLKTAARPSGVFSFSCRLTDSKGGSVISMPARRYSIIESFADGRAGDVVLKYGVHLDGDAKVPAEAKLTYCKAPGGGPADVCARLDYSFGTGWRFVRISHGIPVPIVDQPSQARIWVKGDGGSGAGRLRVTDAGNQTFQPDFGSLNFSDWRCVEADITGKFAGHWGGKNDGKMAYPIKWDTLFLLDNIGGAEAKGAIYVGPMMLCYD